MTIVGSHTPGHSRSNRKRLHSPPTRLCSMVFMLAVVHTLVHADDTLVAPNSDWKYLDDGSDQGTAWSTAAFEDGDWSGGAGVLGFGDRSDQTTEVANHLGGISTQSHTWYFRHTLEDIDPGLYDGIEIDLLRDDGAVVYLNGSEIFRSHMPEGPITYITPASSPAVGSSP